MKQVRHVALALISLAAISIAHATEWNTQDYDLYPGDFDGDGNTDMLYVAKDQSKASGISRSDGNAPNIPFQSWPSNFLGIPWSGNLYTPIVADFNGDGRADIFMQRSSSGDHYLLLANAEGKFTAISQSLLDNYAGLSLAGDQHKAMAGDFNGDHKADLFLQGTSSSLLNGVVLADANGQFTSSPAQTWSDGYPVSSGRRKMPTSSWATSMVRMRMARSVPTSSFKHVRSS